MLASGAAASNMDALLAPWRKLDMEKGGARGEGLTPSLTRAEFEETVQEKFPDCAKDLAKMCDDWRTGALVRPDSKGEPPRISSERFFRWVYETNPMHIGHKYRAVSVQYWNDVITEEAKKAGLDASTASVHDINVPVIQAKGRDLLCPRDGRPGAAYVDCVAGADSVGLAVLAVSYCWTYRIADIASGLTQYCVHHGLNAERVYAWMDCLHVNQHRVENPLPFGEFHQEFSSRIEGIGRVLAIVDKYDDSKYLKRIWCIFELFTAMQSGVQVSMTMPEQQEENLREFIHENLRNHSGIEGLWKTLSGVDVKNAEATMPADKENILKMIGGQSHRVNVAVSEYLQIWVLCVCEVQLEPQMLDALPPSEAVWQLVNVGSLLRKIGRDDMLNRSVKYLVRAEEKLRRMTAEERSECQAEWRLQHELALVRMDLGKDKEAKASFEEAERLSKGSSMSTLAACDRVMMLIDLATFYRKFKTSSQGKASSGNASKGGRRESRVVHEDKSLQALAEAEEMLRELESAGEAKAQQNPQPQAPQAVIRLQHVKAKLLRTRGDTMRGHNRLDDALRDLMESKRIYEEQETLDTPHGADLLMSIGLVIQQKWVQEQPLKDGNGKEIDASVYYSRSREIREKTNTLETADGAKLLGSFATMYAEKQKYQEALTYAEQAKRAFEQTSTLETPMGAFTMMTLGEVYENLDRLSDARSAFKRALVIYEKRMHKNRTKARMRLDQIEQKQSGPSMRGKSVANAWLRKTKKTEPTSKGDQLVAVSWNVGGASANPFEFWITYSKDRDGFKRHSPNERRPSKGNEQEEKESAFNDLVRQFEQYVRYPGDKDVMISDIFPSTRFNELLDLMEQERRRSKQGDKRWSRLDLVRKEWEDKYVRRSFVSGFLTNKALAKQGLCSQPDQDTSDIPLKGSSKSACRPSVITHYPGDLEQINDADVLPTDRWWMRWRNFMFHETLDLEDGSTKRPVELLRPSANVPMQLLNLALYDCALVHIMQQISPEGDWQDIKREVSKSIAEKKLSRALSILRDTYSDADVICLQKVPVKFQRHLDQAFDTEFFIKFPAYKDDSVSATASVVMLRKTTFPGKVTDLTPDVVDLAREECKQLGKPLKPGQLMVASTKNFCGMPFVIASFISDEGIQSKPVASALSKLVEKKNKEHATGGLRPEWRVVFGIDTKCVALQTKDEAVNIRDFNKHCLKEGLRSCFGTHRPEQWNTTCQARTYMQPQVQKAVTHESRLVWNSNPMDHLLIRRGTFNVISSHRDNTGHGRYKDAQNIPSLEFPSDHAIVVSRLGVPHLGLQVQELRNNMFAALSDGRLEELVSALQHFDDDGQGGSRRNSAEEQEDQPTLQHFARSNLMMPADLSPKKQLSPRQATAAAAGAEDASPGATAEKGKLTEEGAPQYGIRLGDLEAFIERHEAWFARATTEEKPDRNMYHVCPDLVIPETTTHERIVTLTEEDVGKLTQIFVSEVDLTLKEETELGGQKLPRNLTVHGRLEAGGGVRKDYWKDGQERATKWWRTSKQPHDRDDHLPPIPGELAQAQDLGECEDKVQDPSTLKAGDTIVLRRGVSFVHMCYGDSGWNLESFVSHWWGEPTQHFVKALRLHAEKVRRDTERDASTRVYWICTFNNVQHRVDLGPNLESSPFNQALAYLSKRKRDEPRMMCDVVMVLDEKATPITRIWCVFESFRCLELGLKLTMFTHRGEITPKCQTPEANSLRDAIMNIDLNQATCTVVVDKQRIINAIEDSKGGFRAVEAKVRLQVMGLVHLMRSQAKSIDFMTGKELQEIQLTLERMGPGGDGSPGAGRTLSSCELYEAMQKGGKCAGRRGMLVAPAGAGKSVISRRFALDAMQAVQGTDGSAAEPAHLPVRVPLADLARIASDEREDSTLDLFDEWARRMYMESAEQVVKNPEVIILDGFDECHAQVQRVVLWLRAWLLKNPQAVVLLTTRPSGVDQPRAGGLVGEGSTDAARECVVQWVDRSHQRVYLVDAEDASRPARFADTACVTWGDAGRKHWGYVQSYGCGLSDRAGALDSEATTSTLQEVPSYTVSPTLVRNAVTRTRRDKGRDSALLLQINASATGPLVASENTLPDSIINFCNAMPKDGEWKKCRTICTGRGTGAKVSARLQDSRVVDLQVDSRGKGYAIGDELIVLLEGDTGEQHGHFAVRLAEQHVASGSLVGLLHEGVTDFRNAMPKAGEWKDCRTICAGHGTGAKVSARLQNFVSDLQVDSRGKGYAIGDELIVLLEGEAGERHGHVAVRLTDQHVDASSLVGQGSLVGQLHEGVVNHRIGMPEQGDWDKCRTICIGHGTGAKVSARLQDSRVVDLQVDSAGKDYEVGDELIVLLEGDARERDGHFAVRLAKHHVTSGSLVGPLHDGVIHHRMAMPKAREWTKCRTICTGSGTGGTVTARLQNVVVDLHVDSPGENYAIGDELIVLMEGVIGERDGHFAVKLAEHHVASGSLVGQLHKGVTDFRNAMPKAGEWRGCRTICIGRGTGAKVSARLQDSRVVDLQVDSRGKGYAIGDELIVLLEGEAGERHGHFAVRLTDQHVASGSLMGPLDGGVIDFTTKMPKSGRWKDCRTTCIGRGSGALFTVELRDSRVVEIEVDNRGKDYAIGDELIVLLEGEAGERDGQFAVRLVAGQVAGSVSIAVQEPGLGYERGDVLNVSAAIKDAQVQDGEIPVNFNILLGGSELASCVSLAPDPKGADGALLRDIPVGCRLRELTMREEFIETLGFTDLEIQELREDSVRLILDNVTGSSRAEERHAGDGLLQTVMRLPEGLWNRPLMATCLGHYIKEEKSGGFAQKPSATIEIDVYHFVVDRLLNQASDVLGLKEKGHKALLLRKLEDVACLKQCAQEGERIIECNDLTCALNDDRTNVIFEEARRGHLQFFEPVRGGGAVQFFHLQIQELLAAETTRDDLASLCEKAAGASWLKQVLRFRLLLIVAGRANIADGSAEFMWDFSRTSITRVTALGTGLSCMPLLQRLSLSFCGCSSLASLEGFERLDALKELRECSMTFQGTQISKVKALAKGLSGMEMLQKLSLDFHNNSNLTSLEGFEALGALKKLHECSMNFSWTQITDAEAVAEGLSGMELLQKLSLDFHNSRLTSFKGFGALSALKKLQECFMDFGVTKIADSEALAAGLGGMEALQKLSLDFCSCSHMMCLEGFDALSALKELQECSMMFQGTRMADAEALANGLCSAEKLQKLSLDFRGCRPLPSLKGFKDAFLQRVKDLAIKPPHLVPSPQGRG